MADSVLSQVARARIPTVEGEFQLRLFVDDAHGKEHLALTFGDISGGEDVLVRVHSECFTGEVLGSLRCDCGPQLEEAMRRIAEEGAGVIVYLRQEGRGIGLASKLRAYNLQDQGYDTVDANLLLGHGADERDYAVAAQILEQLGVSSVRLMTNNPSKIESLRESGIAVTARVALPLHLTPENSGYLLTKVQRMRHEPKLHAAASDAAPGGNGSGAHPGPTAYAIDGERASSSDGIDRLLERIAAHRRVSDRPFVTLSYAQSVDGCIAANSSQPLVLSCQGSLALTHALRASHDAILVGIGTVLTDDPRLTVRLVEGEQPQPVVADSRLRFPVNARLLRNSALPPIIGTSEHADPERQRALEEAGARVIRLPANAAGLVSLPDLLDQLGQLGVNSLMVEGGARIITSFLSERLVDHLVLTIAPRFVGGMRGVREPAETDGVRFPHLRNLRYQQLEDDLVLWGDPAWGEG